MAGVNRLELMAVSDLPLIATSTLAQSATDDLRRARISRRLKNVGEGPYAFFSDYCEIVSGTAGLRSSSHLAAHLLRETESALRDVLLPTSHRREGKGGETTHKREIEAILTSFGLDSASAVGVAWLGLADKTSDRTLFSQTHRDNLSRPRPLDSETIAFFQSVEDVFDVLLERMESRFADYLDAIDVLLSKAAPAATDVAVLRQKLPNSIVTLGYFFEKLQDPRWLPLLQEAGYFAQAPPSIRDEESGFIQHLPWPEGVYLARMAAKAEVQVQVAEIFANLPTTGNTIVHRLLAEATLALPVPLAIPVLRKAGTSLTHEFDKPVCEMTAEVTLKLAKHGEAEMALELLSDMFLAGQAEGEPEARPGGWSRRERALEEVLTRFGAELLSVLGVPAFGLICRALSGRIVADYPGARRDHSESWRPTIGGAGVGARRRGDLKGRMVDVIRDGASSLLESGQATLEELLGLFESFREEIFSRLSLDLLLRARNPPIDRVRNALLNKALIYDSAVWEEYTNLLQKGFPLLDKESQAQLLARIMEGDQDEDAELSGVPVPPAEILEKFRRVERWRQLSRFGEALPPDLRGILENLNTEFSSSQEPYRMGSSEARDQPGQGASSGKDAQRAPVEAILAQILAVDGVRSLEGKAEGLSYSDLSAAVLASPLEFSSSANRFRELELDRSLALFSGLTQAIRGGAPIEWATVLDFSRWALSPEAEVAWADQGRSLRSGEVKRAIGHILHEGLGSHAADIGIHLREACWSIVEELLSDSEPTPEYERQFGGEQPYEHAINTVRGIGLACSIAYGLWLKAKVNQGEAGDWSMSGSPELSAALDAHLDPGRDESAAVRSVYGHGFANLVYLDHEWASTRVAKIFGDQSTTTAREDAAWESFVQFSAPQGVLLALLRTQFLRAIDRLSKPCATRERSSRRVEQLVEHLMVLFLWGLLEPSDPLLTKLFEVANAEQRGVALAFVGRELFRYRDFPSVVLERARSLWEERLAKARTAPESFRPELEAFGWWFCSRQIEENWAMKNLLETLKLWGRTEAEDQVMERLAAGSDESIAVAVSCAELMVSAAEDRWVVQSWSSELTALLRRALASESAKVGASEFINRLVSLGHLEFRALVGAKAALST